MSSSKRLIKYFLIASVVVIILSLIALKMESLYDIRHGNGDGLILKHKIHSRLILIQCTSILITLALLLIRSKKDKVRNSGIIILSTLFFVFLIDLFFGLLAILKTEDSQIQKTYYSSKNKSGILTHNTIFDEQMGYKASEKELFAVNKLVKHKDTTIIYDVSYTFDEFSRRINPANPLSTIDKKFVLFFGGSITFGEGLNDHETLPYYFTSMDSSYKSYNYGFSGYGPNQMLRFMQDSGIWDQIGEKEGICIYVYIDDHIKRANGYLSCFTTFCTFAPYYKLNDSKLSYKGSFYKGRPVLNYLFFLLHNSNFLRYFHMDLPLARKQHIELTASLVEESYEVFTDHFEDGKFYLLIFPGSSDSIIHFIHNPHIQLLNYGSLFEDADPYKIHPPFENHPNARAFQLVSEKINEDLKTDN